jgi:hypothetical protein
VSDITSNTPDPGRKPRLALADLGVPSWHLSTRIIAHLLRALVNRIRSKLDPKDYRAKNLPDELTTAIRGEHREGMWASTWLDALAARWDVSLAGDAENAYPLAAWLPEGWIPWHLACHAVRRQDLSDLVQDGSFLATFATSPPSPDDEELLKIEHSAAVTNPWMPDLPRNPIRPARYTAMLMSTSELHHGADEKDGNVARFRTERYLDVLTGRETVLPFVSGNAWRGQVRDLLALDLCHRLGIEPKDLPPHVAHSLFSGGNIEGGSVTSGVNVAHRRELRRLVPIIDVLGGVHSNDPMDGILRASDAVPVCREAAGLIVYDLAPEVAAEGIAAVRAWSTRLPWCEDLYGTRQLVRHGHKDFEGERGQMLVRTQTILAGSRWVQHVGIAAKDRIVNPVSIAAARHAMALFCRSGAMGAGNARGLGEFVTDGYVFSGSAAGADPGPDPAVYFEHVAQNRQAIIDVLMGVGAGAETSAPAKPQKPAKGGKGAKGAAVEAAEDSPL